MLPVIFSASLEACTNISKEAAPPPPPHFSLKISKLSVFGSSINLVPLGNVDVFGSREACCNLVVGVESYSGRSPSDPKVWVTVKPSCIHCLSIVTQRRNLSYQFGKLGLPLCSTGTLAPLLSPDPTAASVGDGMLGRSGGLWSRRLPGQAGDLSHPGRAEGACTSFPFRSVFFLVSHESVLFFSF